MGELYRQKQEALKAEKLAKQLTPAQCELERYLDNIWAYMSASSPVSFTGKRQAWFQTLPITHFDGAQPMHIYHLFDEDYWLGEEEITGGNPDYRSSIQDLETEGIMDIRLSDVGGRVDNSFMVENPERNGIQVHRLRSVNPQYTRRLGLPFVSPVVLEYAIGMFIPDTMACETARFFLAQTAPGRWINLNKLYSRERETAEDIESNSMDAQVALGVQYYRQFEWVVYLGKPNCPGVTFATDPVGAREFFKLREIPEGHSRRAALRHWVSQHARRHKRGSEVRKTDVREHLRGATEFDWRGIRCRITPSAEDLARNGTGKEVTRIAGW